MAALTRILEEPVLRKALIHTFVIKSSSTARTTSLGIETTLKQSETFWEFQNALGMTNAFYKTMKTLTKEEWCSDVIDNVYVIDFLYCYFNRNTKQKTVFQMKPSSFKSSRQEEPMDID